MEEEDWEMARKRWPFDREKEGLIAWKRRVTALVLAERIDQLEGENLRSILKIIAKHI